MHSTFWVKYSIFMNIYSFVLQLFILFLLLYYIKEVISV
jgi:hypothetical protein